MLGYRIIVKEHGLSPDRSSTRVGVGRAFPTGYTLPMYILGNKIIPHLLLRRSGATITG